MSRMDNPLIPGTPIKPMLLKEWNTVSVAWLGVGAKPVFVQPKYRGQQIQIHIKNGEVTLFDRLLRNVSHIFPRLVRDIECSILRSDAILDSELVAVKSNFQEYLPEIHIGKVSDHIIYVYDLIYYRVNDLRTVDFERRRAILERILSKHLGPSIQLANETFVKSEAELTQLYEYWVSEMEFEGIVIKTPDGKYISSKRTSDKGRVKNYLYLDVIVVGCFEKPKMTTYLVAIWDSTQEKLLPFRVVEAFTGPRRYRKSFDKELRRRATKKQPAIVSGSFYPTYWVNPFKVVEIKSERFLLRSKRYKEVGFTLQAGVTITRERFDKDIFDADSKDSLKDIPEISRFPSRSQI